MLGDSSLLISWVEVKHGPSLLLPLDANFTGSHVTIANFYWEIYFINKDLRNLWNINIHLIWFIVHGQVEMDLNNGNNNCLPTLHLHFLEAIIHFSLEEKSFGHLVDGHYEHLFALLAELSNQGRKKKRKEHHPSLFFF